MSLLKKIKDDVRKAGSNKSKFMYFRDGDKKRIRFLNDMDDGMEAVWHDSFELGISVPCQEQLFGKSCKFCEDERLRTRSNYLWSVWDYDENEVKVFMFPVNNFTPLPQLAAMYENYGTLIDRDYVISLTGKMQSKSFTVIPMDKNKFRNAKAKAFSTKAIKDLIDRAWPGDSDDDEDESVDEESKNVYEEMSTKQLYDLCIERNLEAEKRKIKSYYVNILLENDKVNDDWGDEEEEEVWDEEVIEDEDEWEDE